MLCQSTPRGGMVSSFGRERPIRASTPCDGELGDLAKQPKVGDASAERALNTLLGGASA